MSQKKSRAKKEQAKAKHCAGINKYSKFSKIGKEKT